MKIIFRIVRNLLIAMLIVSFSATSINAHERSQYWQSREALVEYLDSAQGCRYSQTRRMEVGYYDCSSLVCRAYKAAGIDIPTTSKMQYLWGCEKGLISELENAVTGSVIFVSKTDDPKGIFHEVIVYDADQVFEVSSSDGVRKKGFERKADYHYFVMNPLETQSKDF